LSNDLSVALSFSEDDASLPLYSLLSQKKMSSCIPSSSLDKQHFKNDSGIILTGTSFQALDIHSTITDTDALFILPLGGNSHKIPEIVKRRLHKFFGQHFEQDHHSLQTADHFTFHREHLFSRPSLNILHIL
jgi:hypothetical protein